VTEHLDAGLALLDRELLDVDGRPVGKVDDVRFAEDPDGGPPRLEALLVGPQALGPHVGGRVGAWMAAIARRVSGHDGPLAIPVEQVAEVDASVHLHLPVRHLDRVRDLEHWLRDHLIGRLPGARRATG